MARGLAGFSRLELEVIRASKTCLIALEIEETAQDLRILRAIQNIPEDEIEMFFRDCGFKEETVLHIAELIQEGRPQIEELSTSILRRTWCLVIQILVFCIAMVLAVSGGFFAISLGYTGASCQFSDFTNGTCQQGNVCKLQVAAWYEGGIAYSSEFSPPVALSELRCRTSSPRILRRWETWEMAMAQALRVATSTMTAARSSATTSVPSSSFPTAQPHPGPVG